MRILLDMDGVVVDFMGPWLEMYNHLTNEGVELDQIKSMKTRKWVGDPMTLMRIKDSVGFVRNLPPKDGAIDGVKELIKLGHEIVFVSNGTNCPTSGHEKRDWLKYHFHKEWQYAPLVLTYHKHLVRGDCLLDDNPKNLEKLHSSTTPLLWHYSYNSDVLDYTRIYDWGHFLDWVVCNG